MRALLFGRSFCSAHERGGLISSKDALKGPSRDTVMVYWDGIAEELVLSSSSSLQSVRL